MNRKALKYIFTITPLTVWLYFGCAISRPSGSDNDDQSTPIFEQAAARLEEREHLHDHLLVDLTDSITKIAAVNDTIAGDDLGTTMMSSLPDTVVLRKKALRDFEEMFAHHTESISSGAGFQTITTDMLSLLLDSLAPQLENLHELGVNLPPAIDSTPPNVDLMRRISLMLSTAKDMNEQAISSNIAKQTQTLDTTSVATSIKSEHKPFLDHPISGLNKDSLVYDVKANMIHIFNSGSVDYDNLNLTADYIKFDVATKDIFGHGVPIPDSVGGKTRPKFTQTSQVIEMDTIRYNLGTHKSILRKITMQQGEGYMLADRVKKQPNNDFDMAGGQYTTCSHLDHPHFYIAMNKGKVIPNNKVIFGMAHFVLEDVPLYFPFIPFGFFPLATGPSSGFIMPTFGEEYIKGFFIRDGGYYFRISDYVDAQVTGGIYTLGSWNARANTRYMKRYKYTGNFSFDYAQNVIGQKGSDDYVNSPTYRLTWNHSQDSKFRPGTTFSASVNMSSSGYNKHSTTNINDYLNTQTNSSIAYTKNWSASGRFPGANLAVSFNHSQNSRDSTISFTFPNASWSIPKFKPLKRKLAVGKERWYEKISLNYSGKMQGNIHSKEDDLFTAQTIDKMKFGIHHTIPISVSWNILNYINFTPNATYNERWYFKRINKEWDSGENKVLTDTTQGFYRVFDYQFSAAMSTKIYGMFQMKNQNGWLKAVRHVITPSISISVRPDFSEGKYGYYKQVQTDSTGVIGSYSPYEGSMYGVPGSGKSASLNFSLQQNVEAKIRSDRDTTGMRIIKIIDNLSISGSYNFLAERKLSVINFSFSTPITKNFPLKFSGTLDPYAVDENGRQTNEFLIKKEGKLVRLASISTSFSYSLNKTLGSEIAMNDVSSQPIMPNDYEMELMTPDSRMDAELRRRQMTSTYYDFSIPYNLGFNYVLGYTNNGVKKNITQTLGFNGSLTLTPFKSDNDSRWGISFSAGYDFEKKKLTPGNIAIVRDLHCFTMSVNWVPVGYRRSWSFNIRVKADVLKDLKWDKNSSHYDRLYD